MFTDIINAGTAAAAVEVDESISLLRSEFLSLVRASYPEYEPLPIDADDEEVDLQKMDWVDFDRFMFSRTLRQEAKRWRHKDHPQKFIAAQVADQ